MTTTAKPLPFGIESRDYVSERKEAAFCYFYYYWTACNDIFDSTGYCLKECKLTGKTWTAVFGIEINPKGPTPFDEWKQDCWNYIPDGHICSLEELAAMQNTSWQRLSVGQLQKRFEQEKKDLARKRELYSERPLLWEHPAFGDPAKLKKMNRDKWREWRRLRKAYKNISEAGYFQLRLRGLFPSA